MSEAEIPLATTSIAGMKFRPSEAREELNHIEAGTLMTLEPEPTNKYDSNAIKIVSPDGVFLGYVPKMINSTVLEFMIPPRRVECRFMEKGTDLVHIVGFEPKAEAGPLTEEGGT